MPENNQFFNAKSFARRVRSGEVKPQAAVAATLKTGALFAYTTGCALRLYRDTQQSQGRDPFLGPKHMTRFCTGLLERMNYGEQVSGAYPPVRRHQPDGTPRGRLFVCNHRSHLDVPAVGRLISAFMVGSAMAKSWPVLGPAGELAGILYVDRSSPESRKATGRTVSDKLEAGFDVLNFPEGANFPGPGMAPFKTGLFRLVVGKPFDIIPITLQYPEGAGTDWVADDPELLSKAGPEGLGERISLVEHFIDLMTGPSLVIQAHFDEPIRCEDYEDPIALMEAVRAVMLEALGDH